MFQKLFLYQIGMCAMRHGNGFFASSGSKMLARQIGHGGITVYRYASKTPAISRRKSNPLSSCQDSPPLLSPLAEIWIGSGSFLCGPRSPCGSGLLQEGLVRVHNRTDTECLGETCPLLFRVGGPSEKVGGV